MQHPRGSERGRGRGERGRGERGRGDRGRGERGGEYRDRPETGGERGRGYGDRGRGERGRGERGRGYTPPSSMPTIETSMRAMEIRGGPSSGRRDFPPSSSRTPREGVQRQQHGEDTIRLTTNFFRIGFRNADVRIYCYDLKLQGVEEGDQDRFKGRVRRLVLALATRFPSSFLATDGRSTLTSLELLSSEGNQPPLKGTEIFFDIPLIEGKKEKVHRLILKQTREIGRNEPKEFVQKLQISLLHSLWSQGGRIIRGSSIYEEAGGRELNALLILLSGSFQSIRGTQTGPAINIDQVFTVLINEKRTLLEIMELLARDQRYRNLTEAFQDRRWFTFISNILKMIHVKASYSLRKYDFKGFTKENANTKMILLDDKKGSSSNKGKGRAKEISHTEYFKNKYHITLKQPYLPLLICTKPKRNIAGKEKEKEMKKKDEDLYLPLELSLPGVQNPSSKLLDSERANIIRVTRTEPNDRFVRIFELKKAIQETPMNKSYNIDIAAQMEVSAVVLPSKNLQCGQGLLPSRDGEWRLFTTLFRTQRLQIGIVCSTFAKERAWGVRFRDLLLKNARELGIDLLEPFVEYAQNIDDYFYLLDQFVPFGSPLPGKKPVHLVIPVLDKMTDYYEIKNTANLKGIATQCVEFDDKRLKDGVIKNIFYSINSKTGGVNVRVAEIDEAYRKINVGVDDPEGSRWVIMSLDVYHGDTKDEESSTVALITSLNSDCTIYHTEISQQERKEKGTNRKKEIVDHIDVMVVKSLEQFKKVNNTLPSRILFYRDGVGEDMYGLVKEREIASLMSAIQQLYENNKNQRPPLLTYVIAQKRNHLKCITTSDTNPPPGTVIDTDIVDDDINNNNNNNSNTTNFYLYSHKALAGTAHPVHYQVIRDNNRIPLRALEDFTYILAYLHGGCTRSVSIPYPLFLADRACGLAGALNTIYIHENLVDTPFSI